MTKQRTNLFLTQMEETRDIDQMKYAKAHINKNLQLKKHSSTFILTIASFLTATTVLS